MIEKVLTGQCHRCPMLSEILTFPQEHKADKHTLFFPVLFVFVDHGSSLVISHERNLQVRIRIASFRFRSKTTLVARLPRPSTFACHISSLKILWISWLNLPTNLHQQTPKNPCLDTTIQLTRMDPPHLSNPSRRGLARQRSTFIPRVTRTRGLARCACSFDETFGKWA